MDIVEQWKAAYAGNATGGLEWTARTRIAAPVDRVTAVMCAVRPGPVGPDNAAMLTGSMWSRLELSGGPSTFVGKFGSSATVLVEVDPRARGFTLQGRLGWRIVTRLEPDGEHTVVIREVRHLSPGKRFFVPILQRLALKSDARRLERAAGIQPRQGTR